MDQFLGLIFTILFVTTTAFEPYDYTKEMCCSGKVLDGIDDNVGCCGSRTYNYRNERCCGETVKPLTEASPNNIGCCYHSNYSQSQFYDMDSQICCDGYARDKPDTENEYTCCGTEVMADEELCCGNDIIRGSVNQSCCGTELYNTATQMCCSGGRMENERYVMEYAVYEADPQYPSCCGLYPINWETQVCCYDRPSLDRPKDAKADDYFSCCGDNLLTDYSSQICCNNEILERTNDTTYCCDGKKLYDTSTQVCCGDQVFSTIDNGNLLCCWGADQLYDPATQMCCGPEGGVVSLSGHSVTNTTVCCY